MTSMASVASADKVGVYIAGVQYTQEMANGNALRYGVGVPALGLFRGGGYLAVSGDISYLLPLQRDANTNVYYGAGLGLGVGLGTSAAGVTVVPAGLLGAEYTFPNSRWSAFVEGSAGVALGVGTGGFGANFAPGVRLGANYKLR